MIPRDEDGIERATLYKLFAGLFISNPTDETVMLVKNMFQIASFETIDKITGDFSRIFLGPREYLPPYESFYRDHIPGSFIGSGGKTADNVWSFYTSAGLLMDRQVNLLPDHISTELLFMSYLVENDFIEPQKRFLDEHLARWVPGYCDAIRQHAATSFYKEVANMLKEFILSECNQFGIVWKAQ
ncbi:MAG TPA: molecular chaperone TorD family protein [Dissulfurispiraceae bacterium]